MKTYTRTGDEGMTSLVGGQRMLDSGSASEWEDAVVAMESMARRRLQRPPMGTRVMGRLALGDGEENVEGGEDDNVEDDDDFHSHSGVEEGDIAEEERELQGYDGDESLPHCESGGHKFVVDMGAVGLEDALAPFDAAHSYAAEVEAGNEQRGIGYEESVGAVGECGAAAHGVFHREVGQGESQHETAAVAHECLGVFLDGSPEVVAQEDAQRTAHTGCEENEGDDLETVEEHTVGGESYQCQASGEAVDTVNEVEGVDDKERDEYGEDVGQYQWELVDAAEPVERVDAEVAEGKCQGGAELNTELQPGAAACYIVDDADEIDEYGAASDEEGAETDGLRDRVFEAAHNGQCAYHTGENGGNEYDAAEAGDAAFVDLALGGEVVEAETVADAQEPRHRDERERGGDGKGYDEIEIGGHRECVTLFFNITRVCVFYCVDDRESLVTKSTS